MSTNCFDKHVGRKIKLKRSSLGITQGELGDMLGVTFQQIQKYEKGDNRIGAGKLYEISTILNVPVSYFFDGLENNKLNLKDNEEGSSYDTTLSNVPEKEVSTLLKFFIKIKDKKIRDSVTELAKSLSKKD